MKGRKISCGERAAALLRRRRARRRRVRQAVRAVYGPRLSIDDSTKGIKRTLTAVGKWAGKRSLEHLSVLRLARRHDIGGGQKEWVPDGNQVDVAARLRDPARRTTRPRERGTTRCKGARLEQKLHRYREEHGDLRSARPDAPYKCRLRAWIRSPLSVGEYNRSWATRGPDKQRRIRYQASTLSGRRRNKKNGRLIVQRPGHIRLQNRLSGQTSFNASGETRLH